VCVCVMSTMRHTHQLPITHFISAGFCLGAAKRTSPCTYHHAITCTHHKATSRANTQEQPAGTIVPAVCQTPWLLMSTPPRHVRINRRRTHFMDLVFWDVHRDEEQREWLLFLQGMRGPLLNWTRKQQRHVPNISSTPPHMHTNEHTRFTSQKAFRDTQPSSCCSPQPIDQQQQRPPLQWYSALESTGPSKKYLFADELQDDVVRRSKRLVEKRAHQYQQQQQQQHQTTATAAAATGKEATRRPHQKVLWKIRTLLHKHTCCYDSSQQPFPLEQFLTPACFKPQHVRLLVQFTHVWVNEQTNTCGMAVSILQIQQSDVAPPQTFAFLDAVPEHMKAPPKKCSSVHTQTDQVPLQTAADHGNSHGDTVSTTTGAAQTDNARTEHPVYGKYFKMVKKGVPRPAVQHKMRMNGVDPDVLDYPPDKPLPSCDENGTSTAGCGPGDQLTLSLQDTQQLRKTEINADRPKQVTNGAGHGFSLNEIVSGLKSLRKTFFGSGSSSGSTTTPTGTKDAGSVGCGGSTLGEATAATTRTEHQQSLVCKNQSTSFLTLLGAKYQNGC